MPGDKIELKLPYPPSANRYYRHPTRGPLAGRHLISREGRAYRERIRAMVFALRPLAGRLSVELYLHPPDRRKRDLDNAQKCLFDALTHAGVWEDDEQIDRMLVTRCPVKRGGEAWVLVREMAS